MRIAAVVGGLLLVTQIVLLTIQLHVLRQSDAHIRSQDAKATRLYPLQKSSAKNALPVLRDARRVVRPLGQQASQLVAATEVLPQLTSEAIPALRGARQLIGAVFGRDLIATIERTAVDVHEARRVQQESLEIQRQTLAIQKQALSILQASRGIQGETLSHARSLDSKTGGPVTQPASG